MLLNCHSYFSFKYGTLDPGDLLTLLGKCGYVAAALTDINNTSGIPDFFRLAKGAGIHPVAGIDFRNGNVQQFTGLAVNMDGFKELNDFLSIHLIEGKPFPAKAPSFQNAFIIYPFSHRMMPLKKNEFIGIKPSDLNRLAVSSWRHHPHKLVPLATLTFINKTGFNCHRLLRAMDLNTLLSKLPVEEQASPDETMMLRHELEYIYRDFPFLIENGNALLEKCSIDFEFHVNKNKKTYTGSAASDIELLKQLCEEGMAGRYSNAGDTIIRRYHSEIKVISELGFAAYFLINWDILQYAKSKGYFYIGRGSGANSMVAYLLRITDVDPVELDLYFERFINPYRTSPPDFDIDFSWRDRDDVTDYIFNRSPFGREHVALLATYSTLKDNAVTRELGKVFGLPKEEIDALGETSTGKADGDHIYKLIDRYSQLLYKVPSHLSVHAGGILISEKPIHNYTATIIPPKGFPLTQFSMLEAEDLGLYKYDILSQRGLGKIRDAVEIVKANKGIDIDIHDVKKIKEDENVRKNLQDANLMGCFYVESPAMRMLLAKLKAQSYLDLVAASSIIRPGVAQSGMMKEYILRFHGLPGKIYIPETMEELMPETFGVMVYQEDVIRVAHYFAGLTLGEADMLRRGMSGKYRARAEFKKVEDKFFSNCKEKGYDDAVTKEVWRQIESFAGYAFSKGHSASYAVESYQCMYLKTYFPLEYMVSVLNNDGGFYSKEFYVHEARMCGGSIHAPDANYSFFHTWIYGNDIYIGFHMVAELETKTAEALVEERERNGRYHSLAEFMQRVPISVEQLRIFIRIGAFRFTGRTKKQLLWDIHAIIGNEKKTAVHPELFEVNRKPFHLPELYSGPHDDAFDEIEILGFPLSSPFDLLIASPPPMLAKDLRNHAGETVSIAGYLVTRKYARTKHGDIMNFGTFIDQEGKFFDTTHFPAVLASHPFTGKKGCYVVTGKVAEEFGFYSIDVTAMEMLEMKTRLGVESSTFKVD